ncbi:antitoxin Xre/MbcA/ParS toxin-binding domain-containing protein [Candidatus Palauibacter sp.]|uniref:antitoxin Xre/MbcA/ParS toxin-binding domain-containing protein n=1 Tax=Candidatus Palauibacter sp. TaxID=3101350 RepID=UPI003B01CE90
MGSLDGLLQSDDAEHLVEAVTRVFRSDVGRIDDFLTRPHPLLDGESPLDLATSGSAGMVTVLELVLRAEAGVAV